VLSPVYALTFTLAIIQHNLDIREFLCPPAITKANVAVLKNEKGR